MIHAPHTIGRTRGSLINNEFIEGVSLIDGYGDIEGIEVGGILRSRYHLRKSMIHRPVASWVDLGPEGPHSILIERDKRFLDEGNLVAISMFKKRSLRKRRNPIVENFIKSMKTLKPVRVIRRVKPISKKSKGSFRYDGLYTVKKKAMFKGQLHFFLRRNKNQPKIYFKNNKSNCIRHILTLVRKFSHQHTRSKVLLQIKKEHEIKEEYNTPPEGELEIEEVKSEETIMEQDYAQEFNEISDNTIANSRPIIEELFSYDNSAILRTNIKEFNDVDISESEEQMYYIDHNLYEPENESPVEVITGNMPWKAGSSEDGEIAVESEVESQDYIEETDIVDASTIAQREFVEINNTITFMSDIESSYGEKGVLSGMDSGPKGYIEEGADDDPLNLYPNKSENKALLHESVDSNEHTGTCVYRITLAQIAQLLLGSETCNKICPCKLPNSQEKSNFENRVLSVLDMLNNHRKDCYFKNDLQEKNDIKLSPNFPTAVFCRVLCTLLTGDTTHNKLEEETIFDDCEQKQILLKNKMAAASAILGKSNIIPRSYCRMRKEDQKKEPTTFYPQDERGIIELGKTGEQIRARAAYSGSSSHQQHRRGRKRKEVEGESLERDIPPRLRLSEDEAALQKKRPYVTRQATTGIRRPTVLRGTYPRGTYPRAVGFRGFTTHFRTALRRKLKYLKAYIKRNKL